MLSFVLLVCYLSSVTSSELLIRNKRTWIIDSFSIEEEHPGPFPYVLDKIDLERDYLIRFDLFGEGVDEEPKGVLSIDKNTGLVSVHKPVDYETKEMLKLRMEVRKSDLSIDTRLGVEIAIKDINDNPPLFPRPLYEISVDEDAEQGSHVMTVVAYDRDMAGTPNSTVDYTIKSMSPNTPNTKFVVNEQGVISFRGCLDHEEVEKFTVIVEAKDRGEVIRLSSSTTIVINVLDKNNHLPVISGRTGFGSVEEDKTEDSLMRLHVTDKDTPHTPAWKAKYTIHGDEGGHFEIKTDPDTNDGILAVVKPLDYEEGAKRHLSISVENEMPYFSCKVKERMTTGALWIVETSTAGGPGAPLPHSESIVIHVEDTNDPPVFTVTIKDATVEENTPVGTWVEKVTAVDPDSGSTRNVEYKIGHDPAGWVTVDPLTGDITTVQIPDRESHHVINGIYTILVYAVDDGEPPSTGTATLNIHVTDQNDNAPTPTELTLGVCISDDPTTTNITAHDPDGTPYGGPFSFELLGDIQGKWKLDPSYGFSAGLVTEPGLFAGRHTIQLRITDLQGTSDVYDLNVTACDCSVTPGCYSRRVTSTKVDPGAIGIVLLSLFLILLLLLLVFTVTCKKTFTPLQGPEYFGETLLASNTERPGTDCEVPNSVPAVPTDKQHHTSSDGPGQHDGMWIRPHSAKNWEGQSFRGKYSQDYKRDKLSYLLREHWNQTNRSSHAWGYHDAHQSGNRSVTNHRYRRSSNYVSDSTFLSLIHQKISSIHETQDDLLDYGPRVYADEGDFDRHSELEELTICDEGSYQEALNDLGPAFYGLASICMPPKLQN